MSTRRLVAILAADVVGYSRLMGIDEVATLQALKAIGARWLIRRLSRTRARTAGDQIQCGDTSTSTAICLPVWRRRRNVSMAVHVAGGVWLGDEWGLEERSCNPSTPSARNRLTHLATVFGVVLNW